MGKHGQSLCSLPFGLFGSLCLTKLKFSAQRRLIINRCHKFYKLIAHVISKLASGVLLLSCAAVKFILEKFWMSGAGKISPWLGVCWSASRRGIWQSYLTTTLAWYLPCLQLFLSPAVSSLKWLGFLLLIKINVNLLENSTSHLGNVSLIIYTHPTSSSTPDLNLCFRIR